MKLIIKIFVFIVVLIPFNTCKGGGGISVKNLYTYSTYHNDDSSNVYLVFNGSFPSPPCTVSYFEITDTVEHEVTLRACYSISPILPGCLNTDTFSLGVFKNGGLTVRAVFTAFGGPTCTSENLNSSNGVDTTLSMLVSDIEDVSVFKGGVSLYPNPANQSHHITFVADKQQRIKITLFNAIGMKVSNVFSGISTEGNNRITNDVSMLASGFYIYSVELDDRVENVSFVKF